MSKRVNNKKGNRCKRRDMRAKTKVRSMSAPVKFYPKWA